MPAGLELAGIPAALLMGPMVAGAVVGMNGGTIRLPRPALLCAQALIGTMIAETMRPGILVTFFGNWPLFLAIVASVIAMSTLSGFVMSRLNILPGTTAIWGSSAGAATSMLVMADAYGADIRLVAFMQYLRVVFVAAAASLVARYWAAGRRQRDRRSSGSGRSISSHSSKRLPLPLSAAFSASGCACRPASSSCRSCSAPCSASPACSRSKFPNGCLRSAMPCSAGISALALPVRSSLMPAARCCRRSLSILVLMSFSGLLAFILVETVGIDPLTAYLATSPGGMDSIAIIAASSKVDVPFVMALQTARLLLVMAVGPSLARFRRLKGHTAAISFSEMAGIRSGPDVSYVRTG